MIIAAWADDDAVRAYRVYGPLARGDLDLRYADATLDGSACDINGDCDLRASAPAAPTCDVLA